MRILSGMARNAACVILFAMLGVVLCSKPTGAQDWTEFGYAANGTRYNPVENQLGVSTVGKLKLAQKINLGGGKFAGVDASAAFVSNVAYVGANGSPLADVFAIGAAGVSWQYSTGSPAEVSSPAVASGIVYVGAYDDNLYALTASTGALVWKFLANGEIVSSPVVSDGAVYFGGMDDYVYALSASDGALIWSYKTGAFIEGSPAVAGGIVYIQSSDGTLYALDAVNGSLVWSYPLGSAGYADESSPAIVNGVVYVGSDDNFVYALDASTGVLIWKYQTGGQNDCSVAVANGSVYFCSADGNLYSLEAATGALNWKSQLVTGRSSPAVANGVVYVGSLNHKVYAVNAATGATLWSYTTKNAISSSPTVSNGNLLIGSTDDYLYRFDLPPGTKQATTTTLTSSPNPSIYGQDVTFTAVVSSGGGGAPPDGETVSFMKGTTVLGTGTLSGGSATFNTSTLAVGKTTVTADYSGDSNFKASKSKPVKQVVDKAVD